jgi:hypothetical protein
MTTRLRFGKLNQFMFAGLSAFLLMGAEAARADMCSAQFFHEDGLIEIAGSGIFTVNAKMTFSQVKKSKADVCQAKVRGFANYALLGMLTGASDLDHLMLINGTQSSLTKSSPGKSPDPATFDLRLLNIFGYGEPIQSAGQRFPAQSFRLDLGDPKQATTPLTVRTGEKTVGARQSIQTALGPQSCWPVRYARNTDATVANLRGIIIPIPSIQSQITDWFCPQVNLVMKQEVEHAGQRGVIEVRAVK